VRERFSGSVITVAIVAAAAVISGAITRTSAQAPAPFATPRVPSLGAENALGRTRSAGHLDGRKRHALAAARQVRQPRIFHRSTSEPN
jgi:hypothetical protein